MRPGPPFELAVQRTTDLLGIELDDATQQKAGVVFHYGAGVSWAPV